MRQHLDGSVALNSQKSLVAFYKYVLYNRSSKGGQIVCGNVNADNVTPKRHVGAKDAMPKTPTKLVVSKQLSERKNKSDAQRNKRNWKPSAKHDKLKSKRLRKKHGAEFAFRPAQTHCRTSLFW